MSAGAIEGTQGPDYDEVLQLEQEHPKIPVTVCGTVDVQPAQSMGGVIVGRNLAMAATEATKLLNGEETRGSVTLVAGATIFVGYSKNECEAGTARIPGNVPIQIRNDEPIFVKADAADTFVTAFVEQWVR